MKKIYKLALTELQTLFYSPVAWLILVIFFVSSWNDIYCSILEPKVMGQEFRACAREFDDVYIFRTEGYSSQFNEICIFTFLC